MFPWIPGVTFSLLPELVTFVIEQTFLVFYLMVSCYVWNISRMFPRYKHDLQVMINIAKNLPCILETEL